MRIFFTGASGFVGSAVVADLLAAGHHVTGLARSDDAAAQVAWSGAEVHRGSLDDLDSLRAGASAADGVIHLAYHHVFTEYDKAGEMDEAAIAALGDALAGYDRPLVVTSGTAGLPTGRVVTEDDTSSPQSPRLSERAVLAYAGRGVRASAVRLAPTVHGTGDHGFIPTLIEGARAAGVSVYPGDGSNRWPAVHRLDAAPLFRLAAESAPAGTILHAVAEEAIPVRHIAEAIGRGLGVPTQSVTAEECVDRFGFIGAVLGMDIAASSELTRQRFGWQPTHPGLLADVAENYFTPAVQ